MYSSGKHGVITLMSKYFMCSESLHVHYSYDQNRKNTTQICLQFDFFFNLKLIKN